MKKIKVKKGKNAQDIQDSVFKKMSAQKKIHLVSELSAFCLKLNSLNGNIKSRRDPLNIIKILDGLVFK